MNTGFDNSDIKDILRIDLPVSLARAFQGISHVGQIFYVVTNSNVVDMIVEAKGYKALLNRALRQFNAFKSCDGVK